MMQGKMLATATLIRIINVIVLFIINILLSRLAGAAGYGILSLLIANASIFNLVSSLGADSGITFNTASNRIGIRKILSFIGIILTLQLVLLFIVEGLCWLMTGHFFLFKSAELENWWLGPLFLVSISLVEKYTALLQGQERFLRVNVVILIANLLLALILTSFYFTADDLPLIAYIQVYVEFMFLQALFLMIAFHRGAKKMGGLETPRRQDISFFFLLFHCCLCHEYHPVSCIPG